MVYSSWCRPDDLANSGIMKSHLNVGLSDHNFSLPTLISSQLTRMKALSAEPTIFSFERLSQAQLIQSDIPVDTTLFTIDHIILPLFISAKYLF